MIYYSKDGTILWKLGSRKIFSVIIGCWLTSSGKKVSQCTQDTVGTAFPVGVGITSIEMGFLFT